MLLEYWYFTRLFCPSSTFQCYYWEEEDTTVRVQCFHKLDLNYHKQKYVTRMWH